MEEKRKKEEKVRELEAELKRWKNDFAKLETKHFSQTLELKHELNALRSAQVGCQYFVSEFESTRQILDNGPDDAFIRPDEHVWRQLGRRER